MAERNRGQEGGWSRALRQRYHQFLDRLEQNPDLLRHYWVEALAPLPVSEMSRIARGSDLPRLGRVAHGATFFYEGAGVIGALREMTPEPLFASHMLAKGVEGATLLFKWYIRKQEEEARREREERGY